MVCSLLTHSTAEVIWLNSFVNSFFCGLGLAIETECFCFTTLVSSVLCRFRLKGERPETRAPAATSQKGRQSYARPAGPPYLCSDRQLALQPALFSLFLSRQHCMPGSCPTRVRLHLMSGNRWTLAISSLKMFRLQCGFS